MPSYAAAIAYHTIISLAPLLLFSISVASFAFSEERVIEQLVAMISRVAGMGVASMVEELVNQLGRPTLNNIIIAISWFFITLYAASNVFRQLIIALDTIWDVAYDPVRIRDGLVRWGTIRLRKYLVGLVMSILVIFSLLVSLLISVFANNFWQLLELFAPQMAVLSSLVNYVVIPGILIGFCILSFRFLPNRHVAWRDIWLGAVLTGSVLAIGERIIGYYANLSRIPSLYGVAGSVVILMLWSYFSAYILLIGAQFTRLFAEQYGSDSAAE